MTLASCPQCGRARDGVQRFCSGCGFDYQFADGTSGTVPAAAPQPTAADKTGSALGGIVGLIVVGFLVWLIFLRPSSNDDNGSTPAEDDPGAENTNITGEFLRWEPVDDARGYAYFSITNHGEAAATAECTISVRNDFGNFGFDKLVGERIPAGETITGRIAMDVSEGSLLIDEGEVDDC